MFQAVGKAHARALRFREWTGGQCGCSRDRQTDRKRQEEMSSERSQAARPQSCYRLLKSPIATLSETKRKSVEGGKQRESRSDLMLGDLWTCSLCSMSCRNEDLSQRPTVSIPENVGPRGGTSATSGETSVPLEGRRSPQLVDSQLMTAT